MTMLSLTRETPDQDSLDKLPLSILPLETDGLKRARLVKNAQLQTMVELFRDQKAGKGHIPIDALPSAFHVKDTEALKKDIVILSSVASLQSFDVYSLRIDLRKLGIEVNDKDCLRLSPRKQEELAPALKYFTIPLIRQIYGADTAANHSFEDILKMFVNPDRSTALQNLKRMAETLNIKIEDIPSFVQDYGDVFLSLSYYQSEFDRINPVAEEYMDTIKDALTSSSVRADRESTKIYTETLQFMDEVLKSVSGRMRVFEEQFKSIWHEINATSFTTIRKMILSNHKSLGMVLCALMVKMRAFQIEFPNGKPSLSKLLVFTRAEVYPGLDRLVTSERKARSEMAEHVKKTVASS